MSGPGSPRTYRSKSLPSVRTSYRSSVSNRNRSRAAVSSSAPSPASSSTIYLRQQGDRQLNSRLTRADGELGQRLGIGHDGPDYHKRFLVTLMHSRAGTTVGALIAPDLAQ